MKTHLQLMRKKAGFRSAKAFAEYAGVSVATYTGYEQGRIELSLDHAWRFADLLHCSLDEIAGRDFAPPAEPVSRLEAICENLNEAGMRKVEQYAEDIAQNPANTEELKKQLPDHPVPKADIA